MCLNFKHSWCPFWHLGWREREKQHSNNHNHSKGRTISNENPLQSSKLLGCVFSGFRSISFGREKNTLSTGDPMKSTQATVAQGEINQFKGQPNTARNVICIESYLKQPISFCGLQWRRRTFFSKGDFYWFASHRRLSHSFSIRFSRQKLLSCNSKRLCWI